MRLIFITLFALFLLGCNSKKALTEHVYFTSKDIQKKIDESKTGKITLGHGTYIIESPVEIPSGTVLSGSNATLILRNPAINMFNVVNKKNIEISDLNLTGSRSIYNLTYYSQQMEKNLLFIKNSENIKINNIKFSDHSFTPLSICNSSNIKINNSFFSNIGSPYPENIAPFLYSFDGVFIVSEPQFKTENILITGSIFQNIGVKSPEDDGDGVHIHAPGETMIKNIKINNCRFNLITRRGIKIQAGSDIEIIENDFLHCHAGIGITQASPVSKVHVKNNFFDSCKISIATNHEYMVQDLQIEGNRIKNTEFAIRTSGGSFIRDLSVINNEGYDIGKCFLDGQIENALIKDNVINGYAKDGDKDYYMAFLIADKSKNVSIQNNSIKTSFKTISAIYLKENTKSIIIRSNTFYTPKTEFGKKYIIYSHSKDTKNVIKDNKEFLN
ncbi:MAG: right-handed parallel beta-helix repeat-containing protein [Deltaproteobacteria bacterium]